MSIAKLAYESSLESAKRNYQSLSKQARSTSEPGPLNEKRASDFEKVYVNSILAINSGHSHVPGRQLCLREIWFLTIHNDIDIHAKHIPGLENSIADHLSWWHLSSLHQQCFTKLTADFPTTDIFCPTQLFDFEIDL